MGSHGRKTFAKKLWSIFRRLYVKLAIPPVSGQVQGYRQGDLDALPDIYTLLDALNLALAPWGGLKPDEAEKCMKMALRHLLNRSQGVDALMSGMSLKRASGLAKVMAVGLREIDRQVHIDLAPAELRRSLEQILRWVEDSVAADHPVVARFGGPKGRFHVIVVMARRRVYLVGKEAPRSLARKDRAALAGLQHAGAFRIRVVRLETIFTPIRHGRALGHKIAVQG